ncbi:TetR family transcriptional regulator [Shewanella fidelis]|uniref:TetR family transcriptional regulator n=1 Tax=Shewanella fidelis TaxID=173509 RepID=A0AAW8NKZ9_9GAMM|nr:TetR family transcriptional regulator [Shewanella fidelis]MDR8522474.1 TetR family transcriptional regulator [Shewanella fidelis]MDW4812992.1 TetR family transcriptional regulator [Shewanella fidelis]MDW4816749.1 TetR family transcriptional regulator [Shewanella fidelis]MDW4820999.1 TetR family transcriptional regulator [Shewanella fidelis]MDW4825466.1 TetR family transcriptional regulator [Shewanella fidelis]
MAKRSKVQTKQTVQQILDEAMKQILELGYDSMSYSTLSDATGISRTGISHHFPRKSDFLTRLDSRIADIFIERLDFSSVQSLQTTWKESLTQANFRAIIRLFFSLCGSQQININRYQAISLASETAFEKMGDQGRLLVNALVGQSALVLCGVAEGEVLG